MTVKGPLIRPAVLLTALLLACPALGQEQRCSSDKDCPGSAVCENGACIVAPPPARASPDGSAAAPLDPNDSPVVPVAPRIAPVTTRDDLPFETSSLSPHGMVFKAHPLVPIAGLVSAAVLRTGVLLLALPFELEYALAAHVSVFGIGTPLVLSVGNVGAFGGTIGGGVRFYFLGAALNGGFAGVMMSVGALSAVVPSGSAAGIGFDAQIQLGYQWVFDSRFAIGVAGTWSPIILTATSARNLGLGLTVPVGVAF